MYTVPKLEDFSAAALDAAAAELLAALEAEAKGVTPDKAEEFRNRWMARKNGILTQINDLWLKAAPGPSKRDVGQRVNQLKAKVEETVEAVKNGAGAAAQSGNAQGAAVGTAAIASDVVDITLPGTKQVLGVRHPVLRVLDDLISVFVRMGYSIAEGPEVESDYYNFEALNFPPNHPARDTQDTLFVAGQERKAQRDRLLLRTHTSPVQVRTMEKMKPPV
ncbi:MAG TPA: hypothetical protein VMU24_13485, partial [Candidatus Acidoferrales bacterium]|nr:hypothetical protein [Candidatus Acidoferrales bacterium]